MNVFTASDKLILGRETEHGVTTIQFPIAKWIEKYGSGGTFYLWHKRSQDSAAYPVTITSDDTYVYWTPTATDLAYNGYGEAQLDYTFGTSGTSTYKKACSEIFTTRVERSVEAGSATPAAYTAWVTQVEGYADRAETAAEEAEESAEEAAASAASIHGIPSGGTTDQVLKKKSATDYDVEWADESGGGGTSDFDSLSNRPSYNGTTMTHSTDIPEVKTANWDEAYNKAHEHSNKSIIDGITSALISAWNTASSWITTNGTNVLNHIANAVVHITSAERTAWNAKQDAITSSNKLSSSLVDGLADVATSGSYNDLTDTPTIPSDADDIDYDSTATYTAGTVGEALESQSAQIANIEDDLTYKSASSTDVGKFAKVKTVTDGKVSEWEFGEGGSGGSTAYTLLYDRLTTEDLSTVEFTFNKEYRDLKYLVFIVSPSSNTGGHAKVQVNSSANYEVTICNNVMSATKYSSHMQKLTAELGDTANGGGVFVAETDSNNNTNANGRYFSVSLTAHTVVTNRNAFNVSITSLLFTTSSPSTLVYGAGSRFIILGR